MTAPVARGAFRANCPDCPFDRTYTTEAMAAKALRTHSCETNRERANRAARVAARATSSGEKRDCTHPVARHEHGTRNAYVVDKCRCRPCRDAARAYEAERARLHAYGRYTGLVDAQPVREHLLWLRGEGISARRAAELSGVDLSTVGRILHGRTERGEGPAKRVRPDTADAILSVRPSLEAMAAGRRIDGTGTLRRLQALVAIGYGISNLAGRLGWLTGNLWKLLNLQEQVSAGTARAVRVLYDELWDRPNQPADWHAKASATRARNLAAARGWLPPLAWDDDTIDDPNHVPDRLAPVNTTRGPRSRVAERVEDAEFMANTGAGLEEAAERLGLTTEHLEQVLRRAGRADLYHRLRNGAARDAQPATRKNGRKAA